MYTVDIVPNFRLELNLYWIASIKDIYAKNKTKSIGVSEANSSCIWFVNGGIINSYQ